MVQQGHGLDQASARASIMAGDVVVNDHLVDKPGTPVSPDAHVRLKKSHGRYVSRGGDKLADRSRFSRFPFWIKLLLMLVPLQAVSLIVCCNTVLRVYLPLMSAMVSWPGNCARIRG